MITLLAVLLAAAAPTPAPSLMEARVALEAGRLEQARTMILAAVRDGRSGVEVDQLLADLAFAEHRWSEAAARYDALVVQGAPATSVLERGGIAALQLGDLPKATALLDRAIASPDAGWRAWNARGVAADRQADWASSERAYRTGLKLAPSAPELLNNRGWSLILQQRWSDAVPYFARALAAAPANPLIAHNYELSLLGQRQALPAPQKGEEPEAYAARLNDAGVVALAQGDRKRAERAFSQALETSGRWFVRAANNLEQAQQGGAEPKNPASPRS